MKVDLKAKQPMIDKSAIINYEVEIMEQAFPQAKPIVSHSSKYSSWDLDGKIRSVFRGRNNFKVRWIGNSSNAYLETYAYILLIGSGHSETSIMEFKQTIYKLGRQCLDMKEQKLLVQFMNLIEYSNDRYSFLNKYPQIQTIFVKILQFVEDDHSPSSCSDKIGSKKKAKVRRIRGVRNKNLEVGESSYFSSQQLMEVELELEEIYQIFSKYFKFIDIVGSNQYSCTMKLFNEKHLHIIIQKECYFMVEADLTTSSHFSQINKDIAQDFDDIMNGKHSDIADAQSLIKRPVVQESNVIAVERASQIKKPSEKDLFNTPKFSSFANQGPKYLVREFNIPFGGTNKKVQERSFIEDLMGNTTHYTNHPPQQAASQNVRKQEKQKFQKDIILHKMNQFKEMKAALQKVMQKIQTKLKLINEVEQLKSEGGKIGDQKYPLLSNKSLKVESPSAKNINNVCQFIKKNRKISYNQPRPSQKKKIGNGVVLNKNHLSPTHLEERVLSEQARSLARSKVNSIDGSPEHQNQANLLYCGSSMHSNNHNISFPVANQDQANNFNVNVNVSINQTPLLSSQKSLNSLGYLGSQHIRFPPERPKQGIPTSHSTTPHLLKNPHSSKQLPRTLHKHENPETRYF